MSKLILPIVFILAFMYGGDLGLLAMAGVMCIQVILSLVTLFGGDEDEFEDENGDLWVQQFYVIDLVDIAILLFMIGAFFVSV